MAVFTAAQPTARVFGSISQGRFDHHTGLEAGRRCSAQANTDHWQIWRGPDETATSLSRWSRGSPRHLIYDRDASRGGTMNGSTWEKLERCAPLGGVVFVVLVLVGSLLAGTPPKLTDNPDKVFRFFRDHHNDIRHGQFLVGVGTIGLLWWLGSLWKTLSRAEGGEPRLTVTAGLGTVLGVALALASSAVLAATALRFAELGPKNVHAFYLLAMVLGGAASFGLAALVGATSVLVLRTNVFPRPLGLAGGVLAVAWVVAGIGIGSVADWVFTLGFIVFLAWLVWVLAVTALLLRKPVTAA
jgi:hypothetical protein